MSDYRPEPYWSRVAEQIANRGENYVAGDDDPYYRYKRRRFLNNFLDTIPVDGKCVLEVGFGPGGNLKHIAKHHSPRKLLGADISQNMVNIAERNLRGIDIVELTKIDGTQLPYPDASVDISFTATVLQHNTDEKMFASLVHELCRVTEGTIFVMEDIGRARHPGGDGDWIGRQVDVYRDAFKEEGFELASVKFLNTKVSRNWRRRVHGYYNRFVVRSHQEGDPINPVFRFLIASPMPLTRILDQIFVDEVDLAKMEFRRS
ncbi:MAG: class I SAM-dependent methyltransferase [Burkholderiales bacterium]